MTIALAFEHVSKQYRGPWEYRTLRDDLVGHLRPALRRPRPPRRTVKAVDDLCLEISEGQFFGLIGENGAGKTTALKLATRISYPTSGCVRVRGRVGALIEVGTGMHPELTGRENIHLYGRILGLRRGDILRRFDDIVEFAGIGHAIDQPVKQYSSGMQLRLGFSVAVHIEPDVLLVDEAIAVGDAGFQYRCVERMSGLVREGRTLVFVSHDMSAIESLCQQAALLERGRLVRQGQAREVVHDYLRGVHAALAADASRTWRDGELLEIVEVAVRDAQGREVDQVMSNETMTVRIHYRALSEIEGPIFSIGLADPAVGLFSLASMLIDGRTLRSIAGRGFVDCTFQSLPLRPRTYEIWGSVRGEAGFGDLLEWQRLRRFQVIGEHLGHGKGAITHSMREAPVVLPYEWKFGSATPNGQRTSEHG